MGSLIRTTTSAQTIAMVEISNDYKVTLRQTPPPPPGANTFSMGVSVDYTPDEAEQLAQELLEAASGIRAMRESQLNAVEKLALHHAEAFLSRVGQTLPTKVSFYSVKCPECDRTWGLYNQLGAAEGVAREHNEQAVF